MKNLTLIPLIFAISIASVGHAESFILGAKPSGNNSAIQLIQTARDQRLMKTMPNRKAAIKVLTADSDGFKLITDWGAPQVKDTIYMVTIDAFESVGDFHGIKRSEHIDMFYLGLQKYLKALGDRKATFIDFMRRSGFPNLSNSQYNGITRESASRKRLLKGENCDSGRF